MINIIINADDLGKDHDVNIAIAEALNGKYITSASIMANSSCWDEIHKIVDENPQASYGVHLNLTEGKALTNSPILRQYNIVDNDNCFTKLVWNFKDCPNELLTAVEEEWDAQLNKIINDEGINVSHIDGHHHIHAFYPFRNILISLLKKYDIRKVRNIYNSQMTISRAISYKILNILNLIPFISYYLSNQTENNIIKEKIYGIIKRERWKNEISKVALSSDYFYSYSDHLSLCKEDKFILKDNSVIELMCHPGHNLYKEEYEQIKMRLLDKYIKNICYINQTEF